VLQVCVGVLHVLHVCLGCCRRVLPARDALAAAVLAHAQKVQVHGRPCAGVGMWGEDFRALFEREVNLEVQAADLLAVLG
jgi:hypothetical protein